MIKALLALMAILSVVVFIQHLSLRQKKKKVKTLEERLLGYKKSLTEANSRIRILNRLIEKYSKIDKKLKEEMEDLEKASDSDLVHRANALFLQDDSD